MERKYLPISIDITDRKILIVGAGQSAWKKAQILLRFGAEIEFVALEVCDDIRQSGLAFRQKAYEAADLDGYLLVYSCANNRKLDCQIRRDARQRRILCNIHDKPAMCEFVSPAVYQHRHMTVAVASNARDVFQSIKLRNYLREHLDPRIDQILGGNS